MASTIGMLTARLIWGDSDYIVVFKDAATPTQIEQYAKQVSANGGKATHRYDSVLKGFAATIPDQVISSLKVSDLIDYIEPDGIMTTQ